MNALLECPLPIEALAGISELLGICGSTRDVSVGNGRLVKQSPEGKFNASGSDQTEEGLAVEGAAEMLGDEVDENKEKGDDESKGKLGPSELSSQRAGIIFGLLSACETTLLRAEHAEPSTSVEFAEPVVESARPMVQPALYEPLLPPSVSERFNEAMHKALINVMEERDEAHAQLIAANVLHIHEVEQEKRKNIRLNIEMQVAKDVARMQQSNVVQFFTKFDDRPQRELQAKLEGFERILGNTNDEEMTAMCHQLAGEISAKTSHALEVVRLKESRELERKNETAENQALKDELRRVKELLVAEQRKSQDASK